MASHYDDRVISEWTCVVDDGTRPFGPDVLVDQRRPLSLTVGADERIEILLINPVGAVVVLDSPDFLVINARTMAAPRRQILTKRSVPIANHRHAMIFAADSTKLLAPQRGAFDLWLVRGPERFTLIPLSEFLLLEGALGNNYITGT